MMSTRPSRRLPSDYPRLHVKTPLVYSETLSALSGHNIFLKLETEQLTSSFKPRGIGRSCYAAVQRLGPDVHIIVASGGNAGQAAALASKILGVKCTVHVHIGTEKAITDRIRGWGANVVRSDGGWERVNGAALQMAKDDPSGVYIHPFEGDDLVLGHTSVVDEIYDQLPIVSEKVDGVGRVTRPDVVSCAVGGGGLIRGIMLGLCERAKEEGHESAHVIGVSTIGGDSFSQSLETEDRMVELEQPFSQARSLVCKVCSPLAVRDARAYAKQGKVSFYQTDVRGKTGPFFTAVSVDDALAGANAWQATEELGRLIELSCGAAFAPAYTPQILEYLTRTKDLPKRMNVVIVVCGGTRVSEDDIRGFKEDFGKGYGKIIADGHVLEERPTRQ